MISLCVTIGRRSRIVGVPVIEDEVFIGTEAKVLGGYSDWAESGDRRQRRGAGICSR
jgi:hypothetical protein